MPSVTKLSHTKRPSPVYNEYLESGKSSVFYEAHRTEIMLYESAEATLKTRGLSGDPIRLFQLQEERSVLEDQKFDFSINLEAKQKEYNDLLTAKKNVETIMTEVREEERTYMEKKSERYYPL